MDDIEPLAHTHIQCWQETYTDLLPPELISHNNLGKRRHMWKQFLLSASVHNMAYVACVDDKIIGFCSWTVTNEQLNLVTLYLLRAFQGHKIGTKLMEQAIKTATEQQIPIHLWVLKTNHKARRFYEAHGFKHIRDENLEKNHPDILDSLYVYLFRM